MVKRTYLLSRSLDDDEEENADIVNAEHRSTFPRPPSTWEVARFKLDLSSQAKALPALVREVVISPCSGYNVVDTLTLMGLAVTSACIKRGHEWSLWMNGVPVTVRLTQIFAHRDDDEPMDPAYVAEAIVTGPTPFREEAANALAALRDRLVGGALALETPQGQLVFRGRPAVVRKTEETDRM
jgi:hypothetical protein